MNMYSMFTYFKGRSSGRNFRPFCPSLSPPMIQKRKLTSWKFIQRKLCKSVFHKGGKCAHTTVLCQIPKEISDEQKNLSEISLKNQILWNVFCLSFWICWNTKFSIAIVVSSFLWSSGLFFRQCPRFYSTVQESGPQTIQVLDHRYCLFFHEIVFKISAK